ncbi:MAG: flagellar basal body rod protein [Burkholderiales bacterium PBB1]|nr:MAG: flagellar basal body rod protein [Burkholderiales bacterium PBB1]
MATAAAAPAVVDAEVAAPKKGKKKLIIIIAAVLAVLLIGGGVAAYVLKQKAAAAEAAAEGEDGDVPAAKEEHAKKDEHKAPPVFVALDPFVVNLADRETERFAQIGVTLQVDDAKFADELKLYMPAVRNGILMVLAHKTSAELLERAGKERLAAEIMRESVRPMGIVIEVEEPATEPSADADAADKPKKKKKKKPAEHNPITSVNFSSFIIQ